LGAAGSLGGVRIGSGWTTRSVGESIPTRSVGMRSLLNMNMMWLVVRRPAGLGLRFGTIGGEKWRRERPGPAALGWRAGFAKRTQRPGARVLRNEPYERGGEGDYETNPTGGAVRTITKRTLRAGR
jgi:hypothetical protein